MAKLTKADMEALKPGQTLTVRFDTVKEWLSGCTIARREKARDAREDGWSYTVKQNAAEQTLTITLEKL